MFWYQQAGWRGGGLRRHRGGGRSRGEQRSAGLLDLAVQSRGELVPNAGGAAHGGPRGRQLGDGSAAEDGAAERYADVAALLFLIYF